MAPANRAADCNRSAQESATCKYSGGGRRSRLQDGSVTLSDGASAGCPRVPTMEALALTADPKRGPLSPERPGGAPDRGALVRHAARPPAAGAAAARHQGGLRRGRLRRLHGAGRPAERRRAGLRAGQRLHPAARLGRPLPRGDGRASGARTASCTRCSRRWWTSTAASAASARRGSSCRSTGSGCASPTPRRARSRRRCRATSAAAPATSRSSRRRKAAAAASPDADPLLGERAAVAGAAERARRRARGSTSAPARTG